jgi:hypothetical protein
MSDLNLSTIGGTIAGGIYNTTGGSGLFNVYDSNFSEQTKKNTSQAMFYTYIILSIIVTVVVGVQAFKTLQNDSSDGSDDSGDTPAKTGIKWTLYIMTMLLWIAALYCGLSEKPNTDFWAKILILIMGFFQLSIMMWSRDNSALNTGDTFGYNCTIFLILLQVGFGTISIPGLSKSVTDGAFKNTWVSDGVNNINNAFNKAGVKKNILPSNSTDLFSEYGIDTTAMNNAVNNAYEGTFAIDN